MNAEIMQKDSKSITLQVTIPLSDDMLSSEELIQQGVNLAGLLATEHSLSRFDTDGTPIKVEEKNIQPKGNFQRPINVLLENLSCPVMSIRVIRAVVLIAR